MTDKAWAPSVRDVNAKEGFFGRLQKLVLDEMMPFQYLALNDMIEGAEKSYSVRNMKIAAGLEEGEYGGMVFQDSDLAKWLEAAGYALALHDDKDLHDKAGEIIGIIEKAQQPDGYLNSYYTVKEPGRRWTNLRDNHELYCAGHMMEAAASWYEATGERNLLDVMLRMAEHIASVMGPEEGKLHGIPGHEEIELALVKLYRLTGDRKLLDLAKYFIDERGKEYDFFAEEAVRRGADKNTMFNMQYRTKYQQNHLPVREQDTAEGHSVRALYLYSGMADIAAETGDESLKAACERLFRNISEKRMYVTGGVGSTHHGEAFTFDYDLPNDKAYCETCASIALVFFCSRMLRLEQKSVYADVMERALYNTCLAGMAADGKSFFYVNPLEVNPEASEKDPDKKHVLPVRPKWFGCACCPPNLARLLLSIGTYMYTVMGDIVYVNLYAGNTAKFSLSSGEAGLAVSTAYPFDGRISIKPAPGRYGIALRIPAWCRNFSLSVSGEKIGLKGGDIKDGYAVLRREWKEGDEIVLCLDMKPERVYASPYVAADTGRVALMRGPLVYCAESADNGDGVLRSVLPHDAVITESPCALAEGAVALEADALVYEPTDTLYSFERPRLADKYLVFIPYFLWANRGAGQMSVWITEK